MTSIESLLTGPLGQAIGWALLHLLWQGVLVAAILAATLALMTLFAPIIKGAHSRQALDERVRP